MAQLTVHYSANPGKSVSEHAVHRTLLDMGVQQTSHTRASVEQVLS